MAEAITPGGIAAGQGDRYLTALNRAIAVWNKGIYVRPLGEMNNSANPWSGYLAERTAERRGSLSGHLSEGVRAHLRDPARRHGERRQREAAPTRAAAGRGRAVQQPLPEAPDRLEPARERRPSRRGQRGGALLPGARLRRRRRRVDLRRAPHRHGAMAGSRGAVPLRPLASEAVLGAGVGARPGGRSGLRPAHVHLPEDAPRHRGRGLLREPVRARATTSSRSRRAARPTGSASRPSPEASRPGQRGAGRS